MVGDAEDHYPARKGFLTQLIQRLQTVHARHIEVQQDQVRIQRLGQLNTLRAIAGLANHLDVRRHADQLFHAGAQHRMVVNEKDSCPFLLTHEGLLIGWKTFFPG